MVLACFLLTFDSEDLTDRARGTITVVLNPNHLLCKLMDFKCSLKSIFTIACKSIQTPFTSPHSVTLRPQQCSF